LVRWSCLHVSVEVSGRGRRVSDDAQIGRGTSSLGARLSGIHLCAMGKRAEAEGMVHQLTELSKNGYLPAGAVAEAYVGLGDKDRAFHWLAKAIEERDTDVKLLNVDPLFDPIRTDPRFRDLLHRVNLAQ